MLIGKLDDIAHLYRRLGPNHAAGPVNIQRSIIAVRDQLLQRIGKILFSNDLIKLHDLFKPPLH